MKFSQVSEHIYSLSIWMIVPIHVWLVRQEDGMTLVDAGVPPMARGIQREVQRIGNGPITRILLTHGHVDHVGAIRSIVKSEDVPVMAHGSEIPYMEGDLPYPRRKNAQRTVTPGIVKALQEDEAGRLSPVGDLVPIHTPGHSPGHVVWYHAGDRVLLAGDLFTSRNGKLRPPFAMFTADMAQAMESARILETLRPERLEVCHGGPVLNPAEQLAEYLDRYS
mgnify:CR=1 FL=1